MLLKFDNLIDYRTGKLLELEVSEADMDGLSEIRELGKQAVANFSANFKEMRLAGK
jgi:phosphoribosylformylglycinamidine (FGAM) synthase PurS component